MECKILNLQQDDFETSQSLNNSYVCQVLGEKRESKRLCYKSDKSQVCRYLAQLLAKASETE